MEPSNSFNSPSPDVSVTPSSANNRGRGERRRSRGRGTRGRPPSRRRGGKRVPTEQQPSTPGQIGSTHQPDPQTGHSAQHIPQQSDPPTHSHSPPSAPSGTLQSSADLRRENEELVQRINEYKQRLDETQHLLGKTEVNLKAVKVAFLNYEKDNKMLKAEIKGLKRTNEDLINRTRSSQPKKGGRLLDKLTTSIPRNNLGFALKVESVIGEWAARETSELKFLTPDIERNWDGRSLPTDALGVMTKAGKLLVPSNPIDISFRGEVYTSSCGTPSESLRAISTAEIETGEWTSVFTTEECRTEAVNLIATNGPLKMKLKQSLSDACSTRKRSARDHLLLSLNYKRLVSRYQTADQDDASARTIDIQVLKERLRKKISDADEYDFGWWRTAPKTEVQRKPSVGPELVVCTNSEESGNIVLFRDQEVISTMHNFLGYVPCQGEVVIETSIVSLARLDAWINCVVELMTDNDKRGGQRQQVYGDAFHSMLGKATKQLLGTLYSYVQEWNEWELESPIEGQLLETRKEKVFGISREATIIVHCPSSNEFFIAIQSDWFEKYVTKELGVVHDCYIAKITQDFREILCIGTISETHTAHLMNLSQNFGSSQGSVDNNENFETL